MLKLAKTSAVKARTQTINRLKSLLVSADPTLREALSGLSSTMLIRHYVQLKAATPQDVTSCSACPAPRASYPAVHWPTLARSWSGSGSPEAVSRRSWARGAGHGSSKSPLRQSGRSWTRSSAGWVG